MLINLETLIHIIHINLSQLVDFLGQIFDDLDRTESKKKKDKDVDETVEKRNCRRHKLSRQNLMLMQCVRSIEERVCAFDQMSFIYDVLSSWRQERALSDDEKWKIYVKVIIMFEVIQS